MRIGSALFLISVGAILKWAVTGGISGIDVHVVGVILIVVGLVGVGLEMALWHNRRRITVFTREPGLTYVDEHDPHEFWSAPR